MINPITGNTFRFDWMKDCKWTVHEIRSSFQCNSLIARHIQSTFCNERDAWAISQASRMMCEQVGF